MTAALPPEISSNIIYSGLGSGPLMEAAVAWAAVAEELEQFTAGHAATVSGLNGVWAGPSDAAMAVESGTIVAWAQATAAQAAQMGAGAAQAAAAFETVHATITPPAVVAANRAELLMLIATNILGQNFPAIAANEAHYAEMWAQNIASFTAYQASSAAATAPLSMFTPLAAGSSPPAAAGAVSAGSAQGILGALGGLGLPAGLNIFAPGSGTSTTGLAGLINLFSGSSQSSFGGLLNSTVGNTIFSSGFYTPGSALSPFLALIGGDTGASSGSQAPGSAPGQTQPPPESDLPPPSPQPYVTGQLGAGTPVGGLTAPPAWGANTSVQLVSAAAPLEPGEIGAAGPAPFMPMPFGGAGAGGTPPRFVKSAPYGGMTLKVLPKNYGG